MSIKALQQPQTIFKPNQTTSNNFQTIFKQSQTTYPSTSSADTSTAISSAIFW